MRRWSTLFMFASIACSDSSATSEGENTDAGAVEDLPPCGFDNPAGIEWIYIEGGDFWMGDDGDPRTSPRHHVTVPSFFIAKTEVTHLQVDAYWCPGGGCPLGPADPRNPESCPAETRADLECELETDEHPFYFAHSEVLDFARWAGGKVPSEAQWEYAARGGGQEATYPWGEAQPTCELAGLGCSGLSRSPACAHPAGNTLQGVCDMAGNANEWTQDIAHSNYDGAPSDGSAWREGGDITATSGAEGNPDEFVVVRSGQSRMRVFDRGFVKARVFRVGLRLVRDAPQKCDPSR